MISAVKMQANRANAQKSTGPRTPEGKARVARNAFKHGLRSAGAVLLMENHQEYQALLAAFREEWQPATLTEEDLVEQLAVNKWKVARYEAAESEACEQSTLVHRSLKGPRDFKRNRSILRDRNAMICPSDIAAERTVIRFSQLIARLERSYFRALQFLIRLQDRRQKSERQQAQPIKPKKEVEASHAAASMSPQPAPVGVAGPRPQPVQRR